MASGPHVGASGNGHQRPIFTGSSEVEMAWDITGSVGATTVGISAARNLFVDVPPSLSADRLDDARLIVTEVVAALARSNDEPRTLEITLRWDGSTLRIEVRQAGPPPFKGLHPAGQGGHTMLLL